MQFAMSHGSQNLNLVKKRQPEVLGFKVVPISVGHNLHMFKDEYIFLMNFYPYGQFVDSPGLDPEQAFGAAENIQVYILENQLHWVYI